jgi:hypothetical protein
MFKYIFFLNLEVIQLKLLKDLAHTYFVTDKRKTKNKCKKLSLDFFANCCTRCCDVTYNDKDGREKRESHDRY